MLSRSSGPALPLGADPGPKQARAHFVGTQPQGHRFLGGITSEGEANDTLCAGCRGDGRRFGMCDNAHDPNLPRRNGGRDDVALSAAAAAATSSAAPDDDLSGRIHGPGWRDLPGPAAAARAAASGSAFWRTRISLDGRRKSAGRRWPRIGAALGLPLRLPSVPWSARGRGSRQSVFRHSWSGRRSDRFSPDGR